MTKKLHRIGIFGGTFDPVHEGHVRLAEFVLAQGIVDLILFLPAARPPHKAEAIAPFFHRISMLKKVISGRAEFAVSTLEGRRQGPSYTVDSLQALKCEYGDTRLFFLLGADSLIELHHWHHFAEIFQLAALIVAARSGLSDEQCYQAIRKLPGNFTSDRQCRLWKRDDGAEIYYLKGFSCPVSSSEVRKQLQKGVRPQGVAAEVFWYIQEHKLYLSAS
ncbi:MAG TPA: nicotinate (nicotinamide) nucleotide adenylyltransferase [Desulfobulbaceae bacterium]|nr:nicotinate (nicotinamide) nucleotide adenylyltransferase [Desulfobulbaceae bacterium]